MSISPSHLASFDDAPVLIIDGDKDSNVPVQQAEILIEKFESINLPLELTIKPGANHS